jgi:hypothetical protein
MVGGRGVAGPDPMMGQFEVNENRAAEGLERLDESGGGES